MKTLRESHVSNSKMLRTDNMGQAKKNPVGKVRDVLGSVPLSSKKLGKAPKSLA